MRALVIGGTRFVGRHLAEALVARGHEVTVFHRGRTGAAPEGAREVMGDRESDLALVAGLGWDAVFDTCGYVPRVVGISVEALAGVPRYVFVSTISVYPSDLPAGGDEDSPLVPVPEASVEEVTGDTYGGLKVACERVVRDAFGARATIVRPGLVVGPGDYTDRFTYWAVKFATPGRFAVPDRRDASVQVVDARDLGAFMSQLAEEGDGGTFHAAGPYPPLSLGEFVARGVAAFGGVAEPVWIAPHVYVEKGIEPWSEVPLVASFEDSDDGLFAVDNARAVSAGLGLRPIEDTLRDTAEWWATERAAEALKAGLDTEKDQELLRAEGRETLAPE
jgi:2'-hydroxyisoflavone reductase